MFMFMFVLRFYALALSQHCLPLCFLIIPFNLYFLNDTPVGNKYVQFDVKTVVALL